MCAASYDGPSFLAGQDCGTRVAACLARLAAIELVDDARWWNRWKRRLMARALVACAEELESVADESGQPAPVTTRARSGAARILRAC